MPDPSLGCQVHRVLKLQGLFFCISFNHDRAEHLEDQPWKFRPSIHSVSGRVLGVWVHTGCAPGAVIARGSAKGEILDYGRQD